MDMDKTAMLLLMSVSYHKVAERLTVIINKARNLLPLDKKGKLGMLIPLFNFITLQIF